MLSLSQQGLLILVDLPLLSINESILATGMLVGSPL